ncbi:MAG: hypothetical protein ISR50_09260 [Alphaproteobacteria bacterium]|nr:hypothetical protein [Alphaproteobacteria bacterium]
MSSSWQAILSGGAVAIFAFTLARVWDALENSHQDRSVLACAIVEIDTLMGVLQNNFDLVEHELTILSEKRTVTNPLVSVSPGFWDLIKIHTPRPLLANVDLLLKVSDAAQQTELVAQHIRSRESIHVNRQALTTYHQLLAGHDGLLIKFIGELMVTLHELKDLLEAANTHQPSGLNHAAPIIAGLAVLIFLAYGMVQGILWTY